jgi:hypothetical protein
MSAPRVPSAVSALTQKGRVPPRQPPSIMETTEREYPV